jgi:hypothetical protein
MDGITVVQTVNELKIEESSPSKAVAQVDRDTSSFSPNYEFLPVVPITLAPAPFHMGLMQ